MAILPFANLLIAILLIAIARRCTPVRIERGVPLGNVQRAPASRGETSEAWGDSRRPEIHEGRNRLRSDPAKSIEDLDPPRLAKCAGLANSLVPDWLLFAFGAVASVRRASANPFVPSVRSTRVPFETALPNSIRSVLGTRRFCSSTIDRLGTTHGLLARRSARWCRRVDSEQTGRRGYCLGTDRLASGESQEYPIRPHRVRPHRVRPHRADPKRRRSDRASKHPIGLGQRHRKPIARLGTYRTLRFVDLWGCSQDRVRGLIPDRDLSAHDGFAPKRPSNPAHGFDSTGGLRLGLGLVRGQQAKKKTRPTWKRSGFRFFGGMGSQADLG